MKKLSLALCALLSIGTTSSVLADENTSSRGNPSGTVRFTGAIISGACSIAPGSVDQTVDLGSISKTFLINQGSTNPRTFQIDLEDCDISEAKSVSITFQGNANPNDKSLLGITSSPDAGIQILDGNGTPIVLGQKTADTHQLQAGDNTLIFSAYVKGLGENIVEGEFESIANFLLSYE